MSACRRSAVPKLQTCSCKAPVSSCCRFVSQHLRLGLLGLRETARLPAGPNQFEPDIGYHVKSGFCRWNGWSVEITLLHSVKAEGIGRCRCQFCQVAVYDRRTDWRGPTLNAAIHRLDHCVSQIRRRCGVDRTDDFETNRISPWSHHTL